jgi:hypothetical protein
VGRSVLLLALALAACGKTLDELSSDQRRAAWTAANVYPADYRTELVAYLRTYLNDPTGIREAGISEPALKPVGAGDRYVVCVRFNPKRGGGGYAGLKDHLVIYAGGKLDRYIEAAGENCKDAVYAAFPELERLTR